MLLLHPTRFAKLYFHNHLIQKYLEIYLENSFLPRSCLEVHFLISMYFEDFPVIFLLLTSSLILLGSQSRYGMISGLWFFTSVRMCFVAHSVLSVGDHFMGTLRRHVSCCCWMKQSISVSYIQLIIAVREISQGLTNYLQTGSLFLEEGWWSLRLW